MLLLLDDAEHQGYQPYTPHKHQERHQQFAVVPSKGVAFRLEPTVLMAETHSKAMVSSESFGSKMLITKMNMNNTPNDITTVALERLIESYDNSRPKTSTRSVPRNTATRFSTTTAKAFTLMPPAVDCRTAANPHQYKIEQQQSARPSLPDPHWKSPPYEDKPH